MNNKLSTAFVLALFATGAAAQQSPQMKQMQRTPTEAQSAVQESLSTRGSAPLQGKAKMQAYTKALQATRTIDQGDLGSPATLTPRNLYLNASTYAMVRRGTVAPANGPTGVSYLPPRIQGRSDQSMLELHFRAAAGKRYIIDCAMSQKAEVVQIGIGGPKVTAVDGHIVYAVASTAAARDVKVEVVPVEGFEWSQCDIVPVDR